MNIRKIHIDNFGKLSNYDLELEKGFTVLHGPNEEGKSTLMAFIQMMFYGHNGRAQDLLKNPRKKYRPWNGKDMKGFIEFEHQGVEYRLERTFGQSNTSDEVRVWNIGTGERVKAASAKDPGQEFFGLGAEAFEKSVFIGQSGTLIDAVGKRDEITQRLLNLVTTGSEDTSFKRVNEELQQNLEQLVSRNRKSGSLVRTKDAIQERKEEKAQAEQEEWDKELFAKEIRRKQEQKAEKVAEKVRLENKLLLFEKGQQLEAKKTALHRKEGLETEKTVWKNKLDALERHGRVLDQEFLEEGLRRQNIWTTLRGQYEETLEDEKKEQETLRELEAKPALEVPEAAVKEARGLQDNGTRLEEDHRKLEEERKKILLSLEMQSKVEKRVEDFEAAQKRAEEKLHALEALEKTLTEKNAALAEGVSLERALKDQVETARNAENLASGEYEKAKFNMQHVEDRYETQRENAKERVEEAKKPQEFEVMVPGRRVLRKAYFLPGVLVAMLSLFMAMGDSIFLLGLLAAMLLIGLALRKGPDQIERRTVTNEALLREREHQLQVLEEEAREKILAAEEKVTAKEVAFAEQREKLEHHRQNLAAEERALEIKREELARMQQERASLQAQHQAEQKDVDEARARLDKAQEELQEQGISVTKKDLEEKERRLASVEESLLEKKAALATLLQRYESDSVTSLSDHFAEYRRIQTRIEDQAEDLRELQTKREGLLVRIKQAETGFLDHIRVYEKTESVEEGEKHLEVLKKDLAELENRKVVLEAKESQIQDEERKMTGEELRHSITELEREMLKLSPHGLLLEQREETYHHEKGLLTALQNDIQGLDRDIAVQESEVREKYRLKRNMSQIENELEELRIKEALQEMDHEALEIARKTLEASFEEIQQSFGPLLNERTAEIFHHLTGGRYRKVRVSRDFAITFEDATDQSLHEWGFLSGGTIDQAYLALRMAVADLITQERDPLPLLLDDVFTQYDDERGYEGLKFLKGYGETREDPLQILLFTCHQRVVDWAEDFLEITVKGVAGQ